MAWKAGLVCLGMIGGLTETLAQTGPSQAAVDEVVRLGTVAALAPICGMREEAWAFDLRRAAILEATRSTQPDDPALKQVPGSDLVVGALSFAEAEALENFAEAAPAETCGRLAHDPDLGHADNVVKRFRLLKWKLKPSS